MRVQYRGAVVLLLLLLLLTSSDARVYFANICLGRNQDCLEPVSWRNSFPPFRVTTRGDLCQCDDPPASPRNPTVAGMGMECGGDVVCRGVYGEHQTLCYLGRCVPRGTVWRGEVCELDRDCHASLACINGVCSDKAVATIADSGRCSSNTTCRSGWCLARYQRCASDTLPTCRFDEECTDGMWCNSTAGTCVAGLPPVDRPCVRDVQCESRHCSKGQCVVYVGEGEACSAYRKCRVVDRSGRKRRLECHAGQCKYPMLCTSWNTCPPEYDCKGTSCEPINGMCRTSEDCTGHVATNCSDGRCVAPIGNLCDSDAACNGDICISGSCIREAREGTPCNHRNIIASYLNVALCGMSDGKMLGCNLEIPHAHRCSSLDERDCKGLVDCEIAECRYCPLPDFPPGGECSELEDILSKHTHCMVSGCHGGSTVGRMVAKRCYQANPRCTSVCHYSPKLDDGKEDTWPDGRPYSNETTPYCRTRRRETTGTCRFLFGYEGGDEAFSSPYFCKGMYDLRSGRCLRDGEAPCKESKDCNVYPYASPGTAHTQSVRTKESNVVVEQSGTTGYRSFCIAGVCRNSLPLGCASLRQEQDSKYLAEVLDRRESESPLIFQEQHPEDAVQEQLRMAECVKEKGAAPLNALWGLGGSGVSAELRCSAGEVPFLLSNYNTTFYAIAGAVAKACSVGVDVRLTRVEGCYNNTCTAMLSGLDHYKLLRHHQPHRSLPDPHLAFMVLHVHNLPSGTCLATLELPTHVTCSVHPGVVPKDPTPPETSLLNGVLTTAIYHFDNPMVSVDVADIQEAMEKLINFLPGREANITITRVCVGKLCQHATTVTPCTSCQVNLAVSATGRYALADLHLAVYSPTPIPLHPVTEIPENATSTTPVPSNWYEIPNHSFNPAACPVPRVAHLLLLLPFLFLLAWG